jgi:HEPN domain-containing protein
MKLYFVVCYASQQAAEVKVKFTLEQATNVYSSTLSLTWALDGVGGQLHAPAALPPGESR